MYTQLLYTRLSFLLPQERLGDKAKSRYKSDGPEFKSWLDHGIFHNNISLFTSPFSTIAITRPLVVSFNYDSITLSRDGPDTPLP